jgi:hypothetical protein
VCLQVPEGAKELPESHPRYQVVRQIINTLAEKVSTLEDVPEHLKDIEWHVTVVESKIVNALAAPGGHVLVFTGVPHICLVLHKYLRSVSFARYGGSHQIINYSS